MSNTKKKNPFAIQIIRWKIFSLFAQAYRHFYQCGKIRRFFALFESSGTSQLHLKLKLESYNFSCALVNVEIVLNNSLAH